MSKKYYYLSVRYDDEPKGFGYRYISDDKSIKVGDRVLVERQNHLATGHVIETNSYEYDDVPYPVEYIKMIDGNVSKQSNEYKTSSDEAQRCLSIMQIIINRG